MAPFSLELANKLVDIIGKRAREQREAAGFNGSFGDGGAKELETQVRFYALGVQHIIPPEWEKFSKELDSEYETYLRLKEKFEDK